MVSSLSSRLLAGRSDRASHSSSKESKNPRHKHITSGSIKAKRTIKNERNENSMSGYSADREGPSTYPPVVSISLHSKSKSSTRVDAMKCPKRRKKNEMQFAATTVKADLGRAGKGFKTVRQHFEQSSFFVNQDIKLENHVKLVFSKDAPKLLVPPSNIGKQATVFDYTSLISAVNGFYQYKPTQMSDIKSLEKDLPSRQNTWSEPSTSSVSDTLSDYGSDNTNNQTSTLTPLLEDSIDPRTKKRAKKEIQRDDTVESIENMSPMPNAITMTSILQLSKTARILTNSFAPYSIVHANAAFHRLSGKNTNDTIIGKSFFSLLDPEANPSQDKMSLSSFMISSRKGDDPKLYLSSMIRDKTVLDERIDPVKCSIRVFPVLRDQSKVGYFAIEFVPDGKEFDESSLTKNSLKSFSQTNTPMGVVA